MLEITDLKTVFNLEHHSVSAVDGVSMQVGPGKMVGLVGESGSGKSVSALSVMQLLPKNAVTSGSVRWNDRELLDLSKREMTGIRGSEIGLIFQNPLAALNPVFSIGNQMIETIRLHQGVDQAAALELAVSLLEQVNIPDARTRLDDYPHQFSMGMCQRIMIALTLAMTPKLIIADEPTASLDVTVQAQIMGLLKALQTEMGLSVLMISHDLGLISQHCDHIYIMYLGAIVEEGSPREIFKDPKHPYTKALISAIPNPDPDTRDERIVLKGDIPSPMNLPSGCRFHTRCPMAVDRCFRDVPELTYRNGRRVACFLLED